MSNLLTILEKAGGIGMLPASATLAERNVLAAHLAALKAQGHAVSADEVIVNRDVSGELRIIHFLSCKKCSEEE
jgi:hypothetical protein